MTLVNKEQGTNELPDSPAIAADATANYNSAYSNFFFHQAFTGSVIPTYYEGYPNIPTSELTISPFNYYMRETRTTGGNDYAWIQTNISNGLPWQFTHRIQLGFSYRSPYSDLILEVDDALGSSRSIDTYASSSSWVDITAFEIYVAGNYSNPLCIRWITATQIGNTEYIDLDNILVQAREYTIQEPATSVKYGTAMNVNVNVTPGFTGGSRIGGAELQWSSVSTFTAINGSVQNQTKADITMTFTIPAWAVTWNNTDGTIYYRIHMWNVGATQDRYSYPGLSCNFGVTDTDAPKCKFIMQNSALNYYEDLFVQYNITDQINASGLDFSTSGQVLLLYKVGTPPPASVGEYTGYVYADAAFNPGLRPGGSWITGAYGSSYVNFTIPQSAYSYGNTIYHWTYVVDRAGNINDTFAYYKQIDVNDSLDPTVEADATNTLNASFHLDKSVTFRVYKPAAGAALDATSVQCYWDNDSSITSYGVAGKSQNGEFFTFTIPAAFAHYGRLDQIVWLRLNASDVIGNSFSNDYNYRVTDTQAPIMTNIDNNFSTNPNYNGAWVIWNATFTDLDVTPSTCAKLSSAYLYVRNGTPAGNENLTSQYPIRISPNATVAGQSSINLRFSIGPAELSAKFNMYYLIQVNDSRYGVYNYTGNFHVKDSDMPYVRLDRIRNTTDGTIINYNENATFWYYVMEPVDAAGFSDSILSMTKVFYKVGDNLGQAPTTAGDWSGNGWINSSLTSMPNGGYFVFHVPHTAFAYNQYVWAWVNITDTQYNNNLTFQPGQVPYVRINDTIVPNFGWGTGHNDNPNSYHLNKPTRIVPAEPSDASGLTAITVYWRRGSAVTFPGGYDGSAVVTGFTPDGGLTLDVDIPNALFYYGETIHYTFQVTDVAGNIRYSGDSSFLVIDTKPPEYVAGALNPMFFWLEAGKSKNFTFNITDPDYGTGPFHHSSGTQRVEFWYKLDGPGFDLDFRWNATIILPAAGNLVTFQLPYNESFAREDCTLYYMIKVYDVYDNAYATPPLESSQILIYKATSWDVTVTSPKALTDWDQKYYHNRLDITFRFVFTGTLGFSKFTAWTAVWYSIDNGPTIGPVTPGGDWSIVFTNASLAEGHHNITVWHYNNSLVGFLEFKLDVTRPAAPTSLTASYTEDGVQLDWTGISDEDTVYYIIYRGFKLDFDITTGDADLVRSNLVTASFLDEDILLDLTNYYYKVYAVDPAGNLSEVAATASFAKPFPMWMWIVIAGVALGVVVGLVVLVRARGERKLLSAAMEKSVKEQPISKEEDWNKVSAAARKRQEGAPAESKASAASAASDGKKWTTIQTSPAAAKPVAQQPAPAARGAYWKGELGELLTKVVQAEEAGNYAEELRVLEIVQRVAQQMQDQETLTMAQQKIKDIWAKINA